jgi:hypothetical protein
MTHAAGIQQALEYYGVKLAVRDRIGYHHQALDNTSPDTIGVARYRKWGREVREPVGEGTYRTLRAQTLGRGDFDQMKEVLQTPTHRVSYHPDLGRYDIQLETGAIDEAGRKSPSRFTVPTAHPLWNNPDDLAREVESIGSRFDAERVRNFDREQIRAAIDAAQKHHTGQLRNQRWLRRGAIGAGVLGVGLGAKYLYDRATAPDQSTETP